MECAELDGVLNDHRLSSLGRAERAAVDEHLRVCERCAGLWRAQDALAADDDAVAPKALFPAMLDHVVAHASSANGSVGRAAAKSVWKPRFVVPLGVAAAVAIVALIVLPSLTGNEQGPVAGVPSGGVADRAGAPLARLEPYVEGRHYARLVGLEAAVPGAPLPGDDLIEIEEFFMYPCLHCYDFEGIFDPWCEIQPEYVRVIRIPVVFNPVARLQARAYYAAESLGLEDAFHVAMYSAIHERGEAMSSESDLARLAVTLGAGSEEFVAAMQTARVAASVQAAESRAAFAGITGTPSLIVDGEYRVTPGPAGSFEAMLEIADQLVEEAETAPGAQCRINARRVAQSCE